MRVNFHTSSNVVVSTLAMVACTGALALLPQRTFVASTGDDANAGASCRLTAPCRSFSVAIGQTRPGGEVLVLDSAGYGPVTITQAVSIIAPAGVYAGMSVLSGDGVTVSAAGTDAVVLRGLTIVGAGGTNGVVVNTAGSVDVGRVEISGFSGDGIKFNGGSRLTMRDSIVRGNADYGLDFAPGTPAFLTIEGSSFDSNNVGVRVDGSATASLRRVSLTENPHGGIIGSAGAGLVVSDTRVAQTPTNNGYVGIKTDGAGSTLQAVRCEVQGYGVGYFANAGALLQVVDSSATGLPNGAGVQAQGAGTTAEVERSSMSYFILGFYANGNSTMRVSSSTATGVHYSFWADFGGTIYTRQNNMSASGTSGTIIPLPPI